MIAIAELLEVSRIPDGGNFYPDARASGVPGNSRLRLRSGLRRSEWLARTACPDCIADFERGCTDSRCELGCFRKCELSIERRYLSRRVLRIKPHFNFDAPMSCSLPRQSEDGPGAPGIPSVQDVTYRIAATEAERADAYRLVYENYLRKGLIDANEHRLRVTPYHLLPTTETFVALHNDQIVCTVSLIGDGLLGLPMESIYADEVNAARSRNLYVGEVSSLAVRDVEFRCFLPIFVRLTRLMAQYARAHGMDQFLIAAHPKHARFYKRFMGFELIGTEKEYPSVRGAPAVACCLDFARIDRERPACYDQFFGESISRSELRSRPMSAVEIEAFRPVTGFSQESIPVSV